MEIKKKAFVANLSQKKKISLDTSILIYHLEDIEPYSSFTQLLFEQIASLTLTCFLSSLCVTELLTKPYQANNLEKIRLFEEFIFSFPNIILTQVDYEIAKEAARLRAKYSLRTPDALFVATALYHKCQAFVTNDQAFRKTAPEKLEILLLDEFL